MSTYLDFFSNDKLREARAKAGLTQETAGERSGIGRNHWVRYEQGEFDPRPPRLLVLAETVGVKPVDLCDMPENPTVPNLRAVAGHTQSSAWQELKEHWTTTKAYRAFERGAQPDYTPAQRDALAALCGVTADVMDAAIGVSIAANEAADKAEPVGAGS